VVYASTDRALGPKGISAFIVEEGMPGVTKGKKEKKLGIHASDTREIAFVNARVPKENLLGEPNKGYTVALATLGGGRIGIAAQALGIAQAALEAAVRYAGERKQFDRTIGEFDAIRAMLADSAIEVELEKMSVVDVHRRGLFTTECADIRGSHRLDLVSEELRLHGLRECEAQRARS